MKYLGFKAYHTLNNAIYVLLSKKVNTANASMYVHINYKADNKITKVNIDNSCVNLFLYYIFILNTMIYLEVWTTKLEDSEFKIKGKEKNNTRSRSQQKHTKITLNLFYKNHEQYEKIMSKKKVIWKKVWGIWDNF